MGCIFRVFLVLLVLPCLAGAQDRQGRDTPGEWEVTHYKPFGLWDSICDQRSTDGTLEQRCYLRYVEVFSPRPNFGAQFVFVTLNGGPRIEIGTERGTRFQDDGMRVEDQGSVRWSTDDRGCLRGRACVFEGTSADVLLQALRAGGTFAFDFVDRHGEPRSLRWDVAKFDAAYSDLLTEFRQRGL